MTEPVVTGPTARKLADIVSIIVSRQRCINYQSSGAGIVLTLAGPQKPASFGSFSATTNVPKLELERTDILHDHARYAFKHALRGSPAPASCSSRRKARGPVEDGIEKGGKGAACSTAIVCSSERGEIWDP
jgi:hypothetical protein